MLQGFVVGGGCRSSGHLSARSVGFWGSAGFNARTDRYRLLAAAPRSASVLRLSGTTAKLCLARSFLPYRAYAQSGAGCRLAILAGCASLAEACLTAGRLLLARHAGRHGLRRSSRPCGSSPSAALGSRRLFAAVRLLLALLVVGVQRSLRSRHALACGSGSSLMRKKNRLIFSDEAILFIVLLFLICRYCRLNRRAD